MVMRNSSKNISGALAYSGEVFEKSSSNAVSCFYTAVQLSEHAKKRRDNSRVCILCPYKQQCNSFNPKFRDILSKPSKGVNCMAIAFLQEIMRVALSLGFLTYLMGVI